jgi:N-[(2S)-2-amino-2-carboxyethyl]-L-glutamate dehydrogenase
MRPDEIRVIDRGTAARCLATIDPVAVVEAAVRAHALRQSDLPAEGYMQWTNSEGAYTRSVAMLGSVRHDGRTSYGLKLINASVTNPARGIERAGGFTVLFDSETARPTTLVEAGYISALRTAAYTMSTLRTLGPREFDAVTIIGCGTLAQAHARLIARVFPAVRRLHLFDTSPERAARLTETLADLEEIACVVHRSPREAIAASHVIITLTVSDRPYIEPDWLPPGTFVAHVSLDDLTPGCFTAAEAVYVDDVALVRDNPRRVLGAAMRRGDIVDPKGGAVPVPATAPGSRELTGTYGDVLLGRCPAVRAGSGFIISNPFGMAILDVAMGSVIADWAAARDEGMVIDLLGTRQDGELLAGVPESASGNLA